MGLFGRISRGWSLTKASFGVLKEDKEILFLPVLSFITLIGFLAFWFGVGWATLGAATVTGGQPGILGWVFLFLIYVSVAFVGTFFLAATIEMATIRLSGGDPTLKDGLSKAWEKKGKLLQWAVVTATVGILLRVLRERAGALGNFVLGLAELGWAIATYFAVPILVYRDIGPIDAVKESAKTVKGTWGEAATGVVTTGAIFFLLGLLGLIPLAIGFAVGTPAVFLAALALTVAYWIVLAASKSAVDGILVGALYRYAQTGEMPMGFEDAKPEAARG